MEFKQSLAQRIIIAFALMSALVAGAFAIGIIATVHLVEEKLISAGLGGCGAVLCWPRKADDRALRRLQVAAETGQTLAFAWRALSDALNASPAALRLAVDARPAQVRVLKCRGGLAHPAPIALAGH